MTPKLSADDRAAPFPWAAVPRLSREAAALESLVARWLGATSLAPTRLRALVRLDASAPVAVRVVSSASSSGASSSGAQAHVDPYSATCEMRVGGATLTIDGASAGVRAIAQRMLGGPPELGAPRPLGAIEQALWSLVVATALEDLGVRGQVWSHVAPVGAPSSEHPPARALELDVELGEIAMAVRVHVPAGLELRTPPGRPTTGLPTAGHAPVGAATGTWLERVHFDLPLVLGRCALHRDDLARLAVRSVVTLERAAAGVRAQLQLMALDLDVFGGSVGLRARPGALAAEVATGYVRPAMGLPDDAHVELTVGLGTTQLSLRQITELAVGQIIQLGRPLAGPFELRAGGRVLGRGELVDVDGELAVRIVSLGE